MTFQLRWCVLGCLACVLASQTVLASGEPPAGAKDFYTAGARVEVKKGGRWLPATVVKRDGAKAFVKFDGTPEAFNEWVEPAQVREASVVTGGAPPASQPAKAGKVVVDPFAVGAEIEALWHDRWTDTIVLARNGPNADVVFSGAFKETVGPAQMRARGVTPDVAAKLTTQSGLFGTGAKVEIKWGGSWYDGTIIARNAAEARVKTSDGFTHNVAATEMRTRVVTAPPPAPPVPPPAPPVGPTPAGPVATPAAPVAPAAPVDAFVAGALIEFPFGDSNWFDGVVKGREGPLVKIADSHSFEKTLAPGELRFRGVPLAQLSPEKQAEYLKPGAKIESTNGSWWQDGTVEKREARRVLVRSGAFSSWHEFADVRTREIVAAPVAGGGPATNPAATAVTAVPPNPLAPDWKNARRVAFDAAPPGGWIATADPSTQPARPAVPRPSNEAGRPTLIPLPPMASVGGAQNAIWQYVQNLIVPIGSTIGMAVHVQEGPTDLPYVAQIERVDLVTGSVSPSIGMPQGLLPVDMSPDGRRVLLTSHGARRRATMEIWSIESKPGQPLPAKIREIEAFAAGDDSEGVISAATFVDGDHVLFAGGKNDLVLVDVTSMKVVWAIKTPVALPRIAVSPGRRQVAVPTALGVFLLEPMTGNALGLLGGGMSTAADMRFSPDGKKLVGVDAAYCNAWDVETGKLWRTCSLTGGGADPQWVGEGFVMLGGTRLLDLERRLVVWTYQYPGLQNRHPVSAAGGGKFWYLVSDAPKPGTKVIRRQLAGVVLPPQSLAASMSGMKPDELYSWYPGMTVSLSVNIGGDNEKAAAGLKKSLEARGIKVADGAAVRVEAASGAGESRSITYQKTVFGRGGPPQRETETVNITPTISTIQVIDPSGKVLWQTKSTSGGYAPGMISLKEGQTAQDVVNEYSKPNAGFFANCDFPEYLAKPREKEGFGQSGLTANGIEILKTP